MMQMSTGAGVLQKYIADNGSKTCIGFTLVSRICAPWSLSVHSQH
jgi:hypothetical protein